MEAFDRYHVDDLLAMGDQVADALGIMSRAARDLLGRAEAYGMSRRVGNAKRGVCWQADKILELLDDLAATSAVWRRRI